MQLPGQSGCNFQIYWVFKYHMWVSIFKSLSNVKESPVCRLKKNILNVTLSR